MSKSVPTDRQIILKSPKAFPQMDRLFGNIQKHSHRQTDYFEKSKSAPTDRKIILKSPEAFPQTDRLFRKVQQRSHRQTYFKKCRTITSNRQTLF
jgi:hypothetical protein